MDNADYSERVAAFMTGIAHRIGSPMAERERAAITQLAHAMLDPAPPAAEPESRLITGKITCPGR